MSKGFVVDTTNSPFAKLRPVPVEAVNLQDSFWVPRLNLLREVTIPSQYRRMSETGRLWNFRRAAGKGDEPFKGLFFNDSDVYKWVEAVAFSLASVPDEKLKGLVGPLIDDISAAQDEDGYLNTYFTFERKKERWTNLREKHELYCAGHLMQAAIAMHRATGDDRLLNVAVRFADHISSVFGPGKREGTCGHPEIEMALVELYRTTGNRIYLDLSEFFMDSRGKGILGGSPYLIDHKPFRELSEMVGHAVRMLYLNCGAADLYMETGERDLWETLERLWHNMNERKMYVTGAAGSRYDGEAFGADYELPNERAYAETCASIANIMWNWRMFLISSEARFLDILELALYNGMLSGFSLDGEHYFYVNPLADRGNHRRQEYFECACCPPNVARMLASLPGYFYAISDEGIWVNLYGKNIANLDVKGVSVALDQRTDYPWDGVIDLIVQPKKEMTFSMFLRIPRWCNSARITVNDEEIAEEVRQGEFFRLNRAWRSGDRIRLSLSMPVELVMSHPRVFEDTGRAVLKRGPIVYCLEQVDNLGHDVWDLVLPADDLRLKVEWIAELLNGVFVIRGEALAVDSDWSEVSLYRSTEEMPAKQSAVPLIAIPYYAWANRNPGPMTVWVRLCSETRAPRFS